jgi:hypothetical protein
MIRQNAGGLATSSCANLIFGARSDARPVPIFADRARVSRCVLLRDRSNYGSLMSGSSVSSARNRTREYPGSAIKQLPKSAIADQDGEPPSSQGKPPITLIYSRKLRRFEGPGMRHPATLTKTGRSRISRANCPR